MLRTQHLDFGIWGLGPLGFIDTGPVSYDPGGPKAATSITICYIGVICWGYIGTLKKENGNYYIVYWGYTLEIDRGNGEENGIHYIGVPYWGYIERMEKRLETTI